MELGQMPRAQESVGTKRKERRRKRSVVGRSTEEVKGDRI